MAVIKDVANLAGVSISTVSKYFNNPAGLSEAYRIKVERAVKELNFFPNAMARGLRTKRTNTIALIVPDITNTFYVEVYNIIRATAMAHGYATQLYTTEENTAILSDLLSQLSPTKIDGIILCFLDEDDISVQLAETQSNVPIALLSWNVNSPLNSVVLNLHSAIYHATSYLIEQGHTRIAYVNGTGDSRISEEKMSGYIKALEDHDLALYDRYIARGKYLFRTGYLAAKQFMMLPQPPTGIVCANDILAIGCCKYLRSHDHRIPQDVAVTGMDGIHLAHVYDPSITTMQMPAAEMCEEVVEMLLHSIEKPGAKTKISIYESKLAIGRSTNADAPLYLDF